ncbi:hypothetical protein [Salinibius halmophilus]|uniref:hypothetical protein n=1 Tax=Salinibius halmophilus TaxID=1853216 RepID=UPI000E6630ED|nr:hypothetical protein [Salinibius halmophilus]
MKKIALMMTLVAGSSAAQDTLFDKGVKFGGFGGPAAKYYNIEGEDLFVVGGKGGLLFGSERHEFTFGGAGYSGATSFDSQYSFAGLLLGYAYNTDAVVHPELELAIGSAYIYTELNEDEEVGEFGQFVDLTLSAEVNLLSFLRSGVGIGYHHSNIDAFNSSNPSGWHLGVDFEFGGM